VALYQGPHDELPELYRALAGAIDDQGVEPAGEPREVYLASPGDTPDRSVSLVELVWPIDVPAGWRPHERLFTEPLRG
jgi:effector-binding domain-containing protein